ncbi:hypothetical protein FOA52_007452 [Chlamydomonas sp. UWO 241]|nr:hypothetical protein FOA52_007452 [Chlamydomonas sp. UWO 241]
MAQPAASGSAQPAASLRGDGSSQAQQTAGQGTGQGKAQPAASPKVDGGSQARQEASSRAQQLAARGRAQQPAASTGDGCGSSRAQHSEAEQPAGSARGGGGSEAQQSEAPSAVSGRAQQPAVSGATTQCASGGYGSDGKGEGAVGQEPRKRRRPGRPPGSCNKPKASAPSSLSKLASQPTSMRMQMRLLGISDMKLLESSMGEGRGTQADGNGDAGADEDAAAISEEATACMEQAPKKAKATPALKRAAVAVEIKPEPRDEDSGDAATSSPEAEEDESKAKTTAAKKRAAAAGKMKPEEGEEGDEVSCSAVAATSEDEERVSARNGGKAAGSSAAGTGADGRKAEAAPHGGSELASGSEPQACDRGVAGDGDAGGGGELRRCSDEEGGAGRGASAPVGEAGLSSGGGGGGSMDEEEAGAGSHGALEPVEAGLSHSGAPADVAAGIIAAVHGCGAPAAPDAKAGLSSVAAVDVATTVEGCNVLLTPEQAADLDGLIASLPYANKPVDTGGSGDGADGAGARCYVDEPGTGGSVGSLSYVDELGRGDDGADAAGGREAVGERAPAADAPPDAVDAPSESRPDAEPSSDAEADAQAVAQAEDRPAGNRRRVPKPAPPLSAMVTAISSPYEHAEAATTTGAPPPHAHAQRTRSLLSLQSDQGSGCSGRSNTFGAGTAAPFASTSAGALTPRVSVALPTAPAAWPPGSQAAFTTMAADTQQASLGAASPTARSTPTGGGAASVAGAMAAEATTSAVAVADGDDDDAGDGVPATQIPTGMCHSAPAPHQVGDGGCAAAIPPLLQHMCVAQQQAHQQARQHGHEQLVAPVAPQAGPPTQIMTGPEGVQYIWQEPYQGGHVALPPQHSQHQHGAHSHPISHPGVDHLSQAHMSPHGGVHAHAHMAHPHMAHPHASHLAHHQGTVQMLEIPGVNGAPPTYALMSSGPSASHLLNAGYQVMSAPSYDDYDARGQPSQAPDGSIQMIPGASGHGHGGHVHGNMLGTLANGGLSGVQWREMTDTAASSGGPSGGPPLQYSQMHQHSHMHSHGLPGAHAHAEAARLSSLPLMATLAPIMYNDMRSDAAAALRDHNWSRLSSICSAVVAAPPQFQPQETPCPQFNHGHQWHPTVGMDALMAATSDDFYAHAPHGTMPCTSACAPVAKRSHKGKGSKTNPKAKH